VYKKWKREGLIAKPVASKWQSRRVGLGLRINARGSRAKRTGVAAGAGGVGPSDELSEDRDVSGRIWNEMTVFPTALPVAPCCVRLAKKPIIQSIQQSLLMILPLLSRRFDTYRHFTCSDLFQYYW
jgi:hypothetical protein